MAEFDDARNGYNAARGAAEAARTDLIRAREEARRLKREAEALVRKANAGRGVDTAAKLREVQVAGRDLVLGVKMEWTRGFLRNRRGILYGPNPESFGHSGLGGSFGCADPDASIGIGYAMNQTARNLVGDRRAVGLLGALYSCLAEG